MHLDQSIRSFGLAATIALLCTAPAFASGPDWSAVADVETITVLTTDADGGTRDTTIWLLVQEGIGYIRTSRRTTWGANVERDPQIAIRIDGTDYPVRATFVTADAERARIIAGFEEKYGGHPLLDWVRGDDPPIMRLEPR
ncbi:MAG: hypothetical protein ACE5FL_05580 [Myxococcota bacterium]